MNIQRTTTQHIKPYTFCPKKITILMSNNEHNSSFCVTNFRPNRGGERGIRAGWKHELFIKQYYTQDALLFSWNRKSSSIVLSDGNTLHLFICDVLILKQVFQAVLLLDALEFFFFFFKYQLFTPIGTLLFGWLFIRFEFVLVYLVD